MLNWALIADISISDIFLKKFILSKFDCKHSIFANTNKALSPSIFYPISFFDGFNVFLHGKFNNNTMKVSDLGLQHFGGNLKKLRSNKALSQEDFAAMIGVHVTNLSKYERNKSIPSLEIAEKMASALDVSIDELVYGKKNEKARIYIADNELLHLYNKTQSLSEDQKKTVVDLVSAFLLKANLTKQLA